MEQLSTVSAIQFSSATQQLQAQVRDTTQQLQAQVNDVTQQLQTVEGDLDRVSSHLNDVTQQLLLVESELNWVNSRLYVLESFFRSRFFRFLNFFGRWFIYAPDGRIYENTEENRKLF